MALVLETIENTVYIYAPVSIVWKHLTLPNLMKQWMLDNDTTLEIISDWKTGSPILIKGNLHDTPFENTGTIINCEPEQILQYTHLSSISKLPDIPENYCLFRFELKPEGKQTELTLTIRNFPTDTIFKHLEFYWRVTLEVMKKKMEEGDSKKKK